MTNLTKKIKFKIRDILIFILKRLDRNFLILNSGTSKLLESSAFTTSNSPQNLITPLVIDSKAFISSDEMLHFIFNQTFSFKIKDSKKLFEKMLNKRSSIYDLESFLSVAHETLLTMEDSLELHQQFYKIKSEYSQNSSAYQNKLINGKSTVFWPDPTHKVPSHLYSTPPLARTLPFITKNTKIVSAGSCFAMEIAHYLIKNNFNYIVKEEDTRYDLPIASAKWGTIFNSPSFSQLIEKSFSVKTLPNILWTQGKGEDIEYRDPFREDIIYKSQDQYVEDYALHQSKARSSLEEAEVFIITLGLNEVWFLRNSDFAFAQAPWNISPLLAEKKVLSVEDNLKYLQRMYDTFKIFNRNVKIIVSVSPIPLHATFREGIHVIEANCHSKSVLRVAAEEFSSNNDDVYYFPSYESVIYATEDAWENDLRHVKKSAVENVMNLFENMFVIKD